MWNEFFKENRDVKTESGTFRCYLTAAEKPGAPLLVLLHGGGFSALSWAHFSVGSLKTPNLAKFNHQFTNFSLIFQR